MGDARGFMRFKREEFKKEPVTARKKHWKEFTNYLSEEGLKQQGGRCMDCGTPFCQSGCPIGNIIPDWNDLIHRGRWKEAIDRLHRTNNFPEFTGRICPAPCETSCVLGINAPAVTIKNIEVAIIDRAYQEGWVKPQPPEHRTEKTVGVIGSGPAGLACADQLNKAGHKVTVYEKNEALGGLLTLGIPGFKMEKSIVERRINRMRDEGVQFKTKVNIGVDLSSKELLAKHDSLVLCGGAEAKRDLPIPGRELEGIYQAMDFLPQQNRRDLGLSPEAQFDITAKGKKVVVLGGGDTGSDCVGTCNRQGVVSLKQYELLPEPPQDRTPDNPWPNWAFIQRTSSSQEEGCDRDYSILTKKFSGENGKLKKLHAIRLEWGPKDPKTGRPSMKEVPGSEFEIAVDMVLLALGFTGPVRNGLLDELGVELSERGNVKTDEMKMTNIPGVFAAGDMARGQSLVVWAIQEGRNAAHFADKYLMKKTSLPLLPSYNY